MSAIRRPRVEVPLPPTFVGLFCHLALNSVTSHLICRWHALRLSANSRDTNGFNNRFLKSASLEIVIEILLVTKTLSFEGRGERELGGREEGRLFLLEVYYFSPMLC